METHFLHNEQMLLQQIAAGDEPSFRQFFDHYRERVFHYLIPITKSKEIAEELVMDIFLKLWIGREWITEIEHMDAFLQKVAYNKAIDFLRFAARQKKLQAVVAREMADAIDHSLELQLLESDYRAIVEAAVRQLSPQRRLVYTLSREKGLSHDEIARELNLSIHTVSNHTKEALKFIRGFLHKNNISRMTLLYFTIRH